MNITIKVDPSNPGQFFACCGLLELADRLWPNVHVEGKYSETAFMLSGSGKEYSLADLIRPFVTAKVMQLDSQDTAASPLHLGEPFDLRLDWWIRLETHDKKRVDLGGGDQLKTWAGRQLGPLIFRRMKDACVDIDQVAPLDDCRAVYDVKDGKAKSKTISPFYFDARLGGTSLDIGFSADEQKMSVMVYPAVESLALIGLQRFRPRTDASGPVRAFLYTVWAVPLPPMVAVAAASGMMPVRSIGTYRFTKPSRGGDYLTLFSRAKRERRSHV